MNFVWEILYYHDTFLDTHKSDRDACWGSCNDDPKCLRLRYAYDSDMQANICNAICMLSIA